MEKDPDIKKRRSVRHFNRRENLELRNMAVKELRIFRNELKPYKNTLVITSWTNKVVRLVGVKNSETDYVWIYDDGKQIIGESCVSKWIPLKGFIPEDDYNYLVRIWNLNNVKQVV